MWRPDKNVKRKSVEIAKLTRLNGTRVDLKHFRFMGGSRPRIFGRKSTTNPVDGVLLYKHSALRVVLSDHGSAAGNEIRASEGP